MKPVKLSESHESSPVSLLFDAKWDLSLIAVYNLVAKAEICSFFAWERVKSLLIMTSKGETAPCMAFSFLIMVSTAGFGPNPLTNSAGAPVKDLVIQFLTVGSRNLPRASLTSWTH